MGVAELVTAMQEIYRQAEAQLQHVEPLQRSSAAWTTVATGLQDTSDLLRQTSGEVGPGWPDEVGTLYAERLGKSAQTVQLWQGTLAAADLPATVTELAAAITTTVDGVRELWDLFVQAVSQLGIVGIVVEQVEAALQAIVDRAAALLEQLDQRFADAAARVAGAADGAAWDSPAVAGAGAGAALAAADGGAAPQAMGAASPATGAAPLAAASAGAAGVAVPAEPVGLGTGLAGAGVSGPVGLSGGLPPVDRVTPPSLAGLPPSSAGLPPTSLSLPSTSAGLPPSSTGMPPLGALAGLGGGGVSPVGARGLSAPGGTSAAAGGQIPRAGRTIIGAPPLAGGAMPTGPGGPVTGTTGSSGGSSRLFPPAGGLGHGGHGGRGTDVKPGDEGSAHRARPLQAVPGVPPALRGRSGALSGTPEFLTGTPREEPEPAEPLREDLWQSTPPPNPLAGGRPRR